MVKSLKAAGHLKRAERPEAMPPEGDRGVGAGRQRGDGIGNGLSRAGDPPEAWLALPHCPPRELHNTHLRRREGQEDGALRMGECRPWGY